MARSTLGSLVVSLGLEAAEFTSGLTKAEYDAKKFKRRLEKDLASAAKGVGIAIGAIVTAAAGAALAFDKLVKSAADFKDLEEQTGANAEALASFAISAGTAGVEMGEIAAASVRLTKSLTGVDDESKAAGAALAALGIPIKEFKQLDPATQIETVAKALGRFEDGAGKTAVAVALFGKSGAQLLPFLKQLEADGGRQVILTQQQIEVADQYADAQAKLKTEISLYAQVVATEAAPAVMVLTKALRDQIAEWVGLSDATKLTTVEGRQAIADWASTIVRSMAFVVDAGQGVVRVFDLIGTAIGGLFAARNLVLTGEFSAARNVLKSMVADLDAIAKKEFFSSKVEQMLKDAEMLRGFAGVGETGGPTEKRPTLNFSGAAAASKTARAQKEARSEAEKYLESLQRQLERTQELTVAEQLLADVRSGRLKLDSSKVSFGQLEVLAREIDARIAQKKLLEEEARIREQTSRAATKSLDDAAKEVERIAQANEQFKEEIELIGASAEKRSQLERARIDNAIAAKQETVAMLQTAGKSREEIQLIEQQIELLKQRRGLITARDAAVLIADEAAKAKQFADDLGHALAQGAEDAILHFNNLRDVVKSLEQDLLRIITRKLVTEPLGNFLSNFLGTTLGGFKFPGFATGTNFAPGGMAWVGERGKELVNLPRGAQVVPNNVLNARRAERAISVTNNFTIAGPVDHRTQAQIGVMAAAAMRRALRKAG